MDMILDENMEITLSLKNGENGQPIVLGEEELQLSYHTADHSEDYYNHDVLTHLYTRCKYEHDLKVFQLANYARLTCIYMDAVACMRSTTTWDMSRRPHAVLDCGRDSEVFPGRLRVSYRR